MRALFLVDGGLEEPATRARVLDLRPALAERGIDSVVFAPPERAGARGKLRTLREARAADVVVLQRVLPPGPSLALLRRANARLVFDFDDALDVVPELASRFTSVVAAARAVVAGSGELAERARRRSSAVTVVPTCVDPERYRAGDPAGRRDGDALRIGWIGTEQNLAYLEEVRPALTRLAERVPFELRVISGRAPEWPDVAARLVPWTLEGAPAALAALDVGIAPLPDDPWTRGKCGYKALEYMASSLPVVASPVGALAEIVVAGETGFLAADGAAWHEHLLRLAGDAELRRRLGAAGRARIEERYSVTVAADALAAVLERVATSSRNSSA